jgi:hypothetical protein
MAYQAVNRIAEGNSEAGKTWQAAVVRNLAEQISSPPPPTEDRPADKDPVSSSAPDRSDAIGIIQRVSGLSIGELDKTIHELQKLRDFLVREEERMSREIADYLKLAQATVSSTKTMAETIAHFGSVVENAGKKPSS